MTNECLEKLEKLCQDQYERLLHSNRNLDQVEPNNNSNKGRSKKDGLPQYNSLLPLYEKINYQQKLVCELEQQIKHKRQQKELQNLFKALSIISDENVSHSPLFMWYKEILLYCQNQKDNFESYSEDRYFFNPQYSYEKSFQILTFSTRCSKKCLTITVKIKESANAFEVAECQCSIGFQNLTADLSQALLSGKTAAEFVENTLWFHLQSLKKFCIE